MKDTAPIQEGNDFEVYSPHTLESGVSLQTMLGCTPVQLTILALV